MFLLPNSWAAYWHKSHEDGHNMCLRNVRIYLQVHSLNQQSSAFPNLGMGDELLDPRQQ